MLKIENLTKKFGEKTAINNVSITVENGDLFGFIGHNGAGKTTTIKSVVGILPFDQGTITIDNINIKDNPLECKKKLAFIPDNPDLYDSLKGIEYLNFICDVYEVKKTERTAKIDEYAKAFLMDKELNNPILSYSHGMKQKLAIISSFVHSPSLLVLDEPFVGLDPSAAFILKGFMKDFCDKGNKIFFSTHVLEVAEKLCNKIAIIQQGNIIAVGETATIIGDSSLENVFLELVSHE